ncbi:MAG: hypothetical protein HC771_04320 [Synechococcales cyanobacterium CRU_2_2]|nr:hypothetical protein [Synechococcales cyanobacterium CRU_2_2]
MAIASSTLPPTIHCANTRCQAPHTGAADAGADVVCQHCGTPLLRRYLWVVGNSRWTDSVGQLIQGRYWVVGDRILLDTQPGMLPVVPEVSATLPEAFEPYLHLFHYGSSVPKVYGLIDLADLNTFLLEDAPIQEILGGGSTSTGGSSPSHADLMPGIEQAWTAASPQRQLSWLWQIARIWGPLLREGVAQTLLEPELLRVDGSLVRILELLPQGKSAPTFHQLGALWHRWSAKADPSVAGFIQGLAERLLMGNIDSTEQLVPLLDKGLAIAGAALSSELQVATCSDAGPQRPHNQDACFPASGTFRLTHSGPKSITLVCDGLGGHDGGEVASRMAADTIHRYVQTPANLEGTSPGLAMQQAFYLANEELIERNNTEKRLQRQRMGTTVVAAWMMNHLFYLGHVGDSRIYRITPQVCQQLTVDDDVGSQAVAQGQNVYRHAVLPSTAGALTQALGITHSTAMRPTVQRYFFDEDTVLLLCSDGLSDHGRVNEVWQSIVLPTLTQNINVAVSAARLLEVANQRNGHDNSTIALVHYRITARQAVDPSDLAEILKSWPLSAAPDSRGPVVIPSNAGPRRAGQARSSSSKPSPLVVLLAAGVMTATLIALGYGLWRVFGAGQGQLQPAPTVPGPRVSPPQTLPPQVAPLKPDTLGD